MYLTRDAIHSTPQSVRSVAAAGSQLVFDYLEADVFMPDLASDRIPRLTEVVGKMGEPIGTGFEMEALRSELLAL